MTCVTNGGSDERKPPSEKFETALRRRDTLLYSCYNRIQEDPLKSEPNQRKLRWVKVETKQQRLVLNRWRWLAIFLFLKHGSLFLNNRY